MKSAMKFLWQLLMKKKKYREQKGSIRMMNSQRSDSEKINLIEEGKKIGVNKLLRAIKLLLSILV